MNKTISIIMPAFNEGTHIFENISTTCKILYEAGMSAEIVAVDDGSYDNTLEEIERAAKLFDRIVVARNPYNMGKGMALRTGFDYSSGDIIVFFDADLDLHPSQIQRLINMLEDGSHDIVVTSKHHPESQLAYPWSRKVASWIYYMVIKILFNLPVRDTQTGLKVFRREVLTDVFPRLLVKKYAYDVELLATAVRLGYKVYEIPVVLDFKRDLVWGRIQMEDIMSILIDTLAIFYRLKLMKYYDAKRPPVLKEEKAVLVVVSGYPPPDDVIKRLSIDSNTRIACISETDAGLQNDVMYFPSIERFDSWISLCADDFEIIGFLGSGYLPLGSWVKNAVRNFENSSVSAVCGPIIPGPLSNRLEKTAGLLVSSFITTGPDNYLYSVKPIKTVRKCLLENVFLRAELFEKKQLKEHGISIVNNYVYDISSTENLILYDPDVAVSKPVSPLFTPYLGLVARDAFSKGFGFFPSGHIDNRWWMIFPTVLWFVFMIGWVFLPLYLYTVFVMLYLFIIIMTGLSCFDFLTAPLFMSGILLEHFIRAIAFPAGLCAGLFKKYDMRKPLKHN